FNQLCNGQKNILQRVNGNFLVHSRMLLLVLMTLLGVGSAIPALRTNPTLSPDDPDFNLQFPEKFWFSSATSAYQIEGGWNISGKGENIWDRTTHQHSELVHDRSNGDIACDSYHKYKEDIQLARQLGTNMYRFSLSWSRLLPTGAIDKVNEDGVRYYNAVLDECKENGIEPLVTIFHWDLPQPLQDIGGLPSDAVVDYMVDYFDFVFKTFGPKVKYWVTLNEPYSMCINAYGVGALAPAIHAEGRGDFLCAHNLLRAHGRAYRLYQKNYKAQQGGKIGMSSFSDFFYPKDPSNPDDVAAAERYQQFQLGWFAHPVYSKDGDYPPIMRQFVDNASKSQGLARSRLPAFTEDEIKEIRGSADFYGLNHYRSQLVSALTPSDVQPPIESTRSDAKVVLSVDPAWEESIADWLTVNPDGLRQLFKWVQKEYGDIDIIITENGYPDGGELVDDGRVNYYRAQIRSASCGLQ
ncbi:Myrosinase 1, partial [Frankliniella fusca]